MSVILRYRVPAKKAADPKAGGVRVCGSGDDAPMLACALGVGGDREDRFEVKIAFEREFQRAPGG
jgi:hypothetical protein